MIRRRIGLTALMGLVAIVAIGLAMMKVATREASEAVFGLGLFALLVATLGALVRRRGRDRWIGFALFGWAYALVLLVSPIRAVVVADLPGGESLGVIVDLLHPPLSSPAKPPGQPPSTFLLKADESGWHYMEGDQIVDLTSEHWKPWAAYLDGRNAP